MAKNWTAIGPKLRSISVRLTLDVLLVRSVLEKESGYRLTERTQRILGWLDALSVEMAQVAGRLEGKDTTKEEAERS